jgi:hypothetical protein
MNLEKLGRQVFIAGAGIVFLSALFLGSQKLMHQHYKSENKNVVDAVSRELTGDNAHARERMDKFRTVGKFTFGAGLLVMVVGGVFVYTAKQQR